ncbi:glycosyltransferase [Candidatus Saccharibacteria bacterium]|nr:glycosyltransferase [Candidatus Saccharibacteria bacterium]
MKYASRRQPYPLISVCVISYNNARYLSDCIESILIQTYPNIELVFCDDKSTDDSIEIFEEIIKKKNLGKKKLKINRQYRKENGGIIQNERTAIEAFNGNYVVFVDSDDIIMPNHVRYLYEMLKLTGADMGTSGHFTFEDRSDIRKGVNANKKQKFKVQKTSEVIDALFLFNNKIPFAWWHRIYKKEIMKKILDIDIKYFKNSDSAISLPAMVFSQTIAISEVKTYGWRVNNNSQSRKKPMNYARKFSLNSLNGLTRILQRYIPEVDLLDLNRRRNDIIKKHIRNQMITTFHDRLVSLRRLLKNETLVTRGLKYGVFSRVKNIKKPPIKVYWWNEKPNFGDQVTVDIIRELFGYRAEWSPIDQCDLIGAGSVLGWANGKGGHVWGSGFMFPDANVNHDLTYCAVRGKDSRSRLDRKWRKIPLGDPGLLVNIVYGASRQKTDIIGVIPHYVDKDLPIIDRMLADSRFIVMDVADSPAKIAEQIDQCKLVLSSSLHGLIFSDSFGVPNIHIELSDKVAGSGYKFRDYYSGIDKEYKQATIERLFDEDYHVELISQYEKVKNLVKIQRQLIDAFPYK